MFLLETSTSSQNIRSNIVDSGLKDSSSSLGNSGDIFIGDSTSTEDSSVSKPLSGKISNGKLGQDDIGSNIMDFLQFVIDDLPFSIDNGLEIINIADSDISIFLLRFKFKFNLQDDDLGVLE